MWDRWVGDPNHAWSSLPKAHLLWSLNPPSHTLRKEDRTESLDMQDTMTGHYLDTHVSVTHTTSIITDHSSSLRSH